MRGLPPPASTTKTLPLPSTATASGPSNCPSPVPTLPHVVRKVPLFVVLWERWMGASTRREMPLPPAGTTGEEVHGAPSPPNIWLVQFTAQSPVRSTHGRGVVVVVEPNGVVVVVVVCRV